MYFINYYFRCVNAIYNDQCLNQCPDNTRLEVVKDSLTALITINCEGKMIYYLNNFVMIMKMIIDD